MMRHFFIGIVFFCLPLVTFAQTSEFLIRVFGGEDLVPPTTPTLLSVEPVASSQIDVTWSVSSDNIQLGGYVLLRDSVAIATTTLTTFSDTGLTASTTYSYEVYAFDSFNNISTTSNALATTTLPIPVPPPAATSTSPSSATLVFQLVDFTVVTSPTSALFDWETTLPSRFSLRWGRNDSYDDGYILNDVYRREHQTVVGELEPGTVYLYELVGYTPTGRSVVLKTGEFKTETPTVFGGTPSNVSGLLATVSGTDVNLTYQLPSSVPGAQVRIVRSHLGFPNDRYDGAVVYEGDAERFVDRGALTDYDGMYYTVFVISADGSVSSGAVVFVSKQTATAPGIPASTSTETATVPPPLPPLEEDIPLPTYNFSVSDIELIQSRGTFSFGDETLTLDSTEPFMIRIPYTAVPDNLKSIVVTLLDPSNPTRSYSFLLRINPERTAYEATVAALQVEGMSRIELEIFDFERMLAARYQKLVSFSNLSPVQTEVLFPDKIVSVVSSFFNGAVLIALAVLLFLFLLYQRSRETEDKL